MEILNHQKLPEQPVHRSGGPVTSITFDVALTIESTDALEGGAGFKIAVFGMGASAGGKKGKGSKNVVVNRIQFEVPVVLLPPKEEMQPPLPGLSKTLPS